MAEATVARRTGSGIARILSMLLVLVLLLAVLAYGAVRWLDTDSGRAFVVRQLPLYNPQSGMTVRVGRIDGSIYGKAVIHDLIIGDPKGDFAIVPRLELDWRPFDLARSVLTARSVVAPEVRMLRGPRFNPSDRFLPDFDFDIADFRVDRLILEPPVAGQRQVLRLAGNTLIKAGRAKLRLDVLNLAQPGRAGSGDVIRLLLDAEPDNDRFDMDATIAAPAGGAIAGILGLTRPLEVTLKGDGRWAVWQGRFAARLGGAPLAEAGITARSGVFALQGSAMPGQLLTGTAARVLGPVLAIDGSANIVDREVDLTARLASRALAVDIRGRLDLGAQEVDTMVIGAQLLDPAAIDPAFRARDLRLTAKLAGAFGDMLVDYRLTAPAAAWGATTASDLRVAGILRTGTRPLLVPINLAATRLSGLGASADALLTNIRIDGPLLLEGGGLRSNALRFRSDRLSGTGTLLVRNGSFVGTVKGALPGYPIAGLGVADLVGDLRIASAAGGLRVGGRAEARVRRLDNATALRVLQGLPTLAADFDVAPDLAMNFRNVRLASPGLTMTGAGTRAANGVLKLNASGVSRDYGPLTLAVAGQPTAPVINFTAARPGLGIGLAAVSGRVTQGLAGWSFAVDGQSSYGAVTGRGLVRPGPGPLAIDIASAGLAGVTGSGSLVQTAAGPFAGILRFAGKGLTGTGTLSAAGNVQRAEVTADARDARLELATPVTIASGKLRLDILLPAAGPSATGNFAVAGIERDGLRIDKADGTITYAGGRGSARASASGSTDIPFNVAVTAGFTPDRIEIGASGKLDDKTITLSGPAVLTRSPAGWALAPFSVVTPDGRAEISGRFGRDQAIRARLDRVALALLTIAYPSLDVSGRISGTIDIMLPQNGVPTGSAALRLNSLSRAGIASSSTPIDVGLNAELTAAGAVARAVIVQGGKVEGRAQARVGPIPAGTAPLMQRLLASPVLAQLRYNGPAQSLWGLAGLEAVDVRGAISVAVDANGQLGDPRLTGNLRGAGLRIESTLLGAVVEQVSLESRFAGSRLEILRFAGKAGRDGRIGGTGGIDLSAERAFPIDVRLQLQKAQILGRDDIGGTASGNIRIATDAYGGVVSGRLAVDRASYAIGRTAVAQVPVLAVTERNTQVLGRRVTLYAAPTRWLLDVRVAADNQLFVRGMGLDTEWRADLRIRGGATTPEVDGKVDLVRGDYEFAGKRFTLTRGVVRFAGQYPPDPQIDIIAESSASGFTAQLAIQGTASRPQIAFSSIPALPEDEVLSRLLFGESVSNLSAPEALQLAGALASLRGGGGFNPINSVRKGLGIDRLRILPADQITGRGTAVAAGQYIGRDVYLELATDAQGYTATNIEVSLTRSLSILSQVSTLGGTSVNLRWKRDY